MKIERLTAEEFLEKIRGAHEWTVRFMPIFRERVLIGKDEDGTTWHYFGPDPKITPEEAYAAFLINIDALSGNAGFTITLPQVRGSLCRITQTGKSF
jgi:hypothetical protein